MILDKMLSFNHHLKEKIAKANKDYDYTIVYLFA